MGKLPVTLGSAVDNSYSGFSNPSQLARHDLAELTEKVTIIRIPKNPFSKLPIALQITAYELILGQVINLSILVESTR